MNDLIIYHNPDVLGFSAEEIRDLSAFTRQPNEQILGQRVWVITAEGRPRRYYLRSCFVVDEVRTPDLGLGNTILKGAQGKIFDPMPELNGLDWFSRLKKAEGNFRFGPRAIREPLFIASLEKLASDSEPATEKAIGLEKSLNLNRRRLVGNAKKRRAKMIAFGWYGGKYSHLDFILPNLPNGGVSNADE